MAVLHWPNKLRYVAFFVHLRLYGVIRLDSPMNFVFINSKIVSKRHRFEL